MSEVNEVVKRIVVLPVNTGDTVYVILPGRKRIAEAKVKTITVARHGVYNFFYLVAEHVKPDQSVALLQCVFGITAFSTLDEAEKELCFKPRA